MRPAANPGDECVLLLCMPLFTFLFGEPVCLTEGRFIGVVIGMLAVAAAEVKGGADAGLPVFLQRGFGL